MFAHEAKIAMSASEAALVVVDGVSGVEVVTEKVWQYAEEINLPRVICVSRMDRERANYETALESLVSAFGRLVVPVQIPIGSEKSLKGVVDLVTMKAYTYDMGGNGKGKEGPIPAELEAAAKEAHEKLVEIVAEGKDELMEEFFDKGHHRRRTPDPRAARGHQGRQDFSRAVCLRTGQHRHGPSAGFRSRLLSHRRGACSGAR